MPRRNAERPDLPRPASRRGARPVLIHGRDRRPVDLVPLQGDDRAGPDPPGHGLRPPGPRLQRRPPPRATPRSTMRGTSSAVMDDVGASAGRRSSATASARWWRSTRRRSPPAGSTPWSSPTPTSPRLRAPRRPQPVGPLAGLPPGGGRRRRQAFERALVRPRQVLRPGHAPRRPDPAPVPPGRGTARPEPAAPPGGNHRGGRLEGRGRPDRRQDPLDPPARPWPCTARAPPSWLDGPLPRRPPARLPERPRPRGPVTARPRRTPAGVHPRPSRPGSSRSTPRCSHPEGGSSMNAPTFLVTGAARGIGRGTALALAASGRTLGLIDRDHVALRETADELRSRGARAGLGRGRRRRPRTVGPEAVHAIESAVGPTDGPRRLRGDRRADSGPRPRPRRAGGDAAGQRGRRGPDDRGGTCRG